VFSFAPYPNDAEVSKTQSAAEYDSYKTSCVGLQSDHGGEDRGNESAASAKAAERRSGVAGVGAGRGSSSSLDAEGGASDDLSRAAAGDGGGDGGRDGRVGGGAAARPGTSPRRERSPAGSPGRPGVAVDTAGLGAPRTPAARATTETTGTAVVASPHTRAAPWTLTTPSAGSRGKTSRASRDPAGPLRGVPAATGTEARAGGDLRRPGRTARGGTECGLLRVCDGATGVGAKLCNSTVDGWWKESACCALIAIFSASLTLLVGRVGARRRDASVQLRDGGLVGAKAVPTGRGRARGTIPASHAVRPRAGWQPCESRRGKEGSRQGRSVGLHVG
jgi:hypothetical protein